MELKTLISLYINVRLNECGLHINRNHPIVPDSDKEILKAAVTVCSQLERDARFSDIMASFKTFGIHRDSFHVVLEQLIVGELNWARVMAVVTLAGALAVQCVKDGNEHNIDFIQDWTNSFAEAKLNNWIDTNGGLKELLKLSRQQKTETNHWEKHLIAAGTLGVIIGLYVASKA